MEFEDVEEWIWKKAIIFLQYVEQQQNSTAKDVLNIRKWSDLSFRKSVKFKTKKKITNLYKKIGIFCVIICSKV